MERAERILTKKEFCQAVGISPSTESRLRAAGRLNYYRVGTGHGRIKYSERHVQEYLQECERSRKAGAGQE